MSEPRLRREACVTVMTLKFTISELQRIINRLLDDDSRGNLFVSLHEQIGALKQAHKDLTKALETT